MTEKNPDHAPVCESGHPLGAGESRCSVCGKRIKMQWMSDSSGASTRNSAARFDPFAGSNFKWSMAGLLGVLLLLGLVIAAAQSSSQEDADTQAPFVELVSEAQSTKTTNDLQVVTAKQRLGDAICKLLPGNLEVSDWTGTVSTVTTELGGDEGLVKISIGKGIDVISEDIEPDSEVFASASSMSPGDPVVFSGTFKSDSKFCIKENSWFSSNGLRTPDFLMDISELR